MIRVVVLDVDDTLYLERDYVRSGFYAVGRWVQEVMDVPGLSETAWELFLAGRRRTTLTDALALCGVEVTDDLRREAVRIYREHEPAIRPTDDAAGFLDGTVTTPPLAVVTDGPSASQRAKCLALGLYDRADPVVITADHGSSKPDPEMFRVVERAHGARRSELIYVADNPTKDFMGPQQLGWRCLRIRRPGSLHFTAPTPPGVPEAADLRGLHALLQDA